MPPPSAWRREAEISQRRSDARRLASGERPGVPPDLLLIIALVVVFWVVVGVAVWLLWLR